MRAKTILSVLFLISVAVAAFVIIRALPQLAPAGAQEAARDDILVAAAPLQAGTLLRAQDVVWQKAKSDTQPGQIVRPDAATRDTKPELDEEARAVVYGAALRRPVTEGDPIRRVDVAKPGDRDFLDIVLSPGMRAMSFPITVLGATGPNTRFLGPLPGDRVDLILTQVFKDNPALPITRHSVGEAVVQNVRVLATPLPDTKTTNNSNAETKTALMLEVTPEQAEKITVASELGKLAVTLRGTSDKDGVVAGSTPGAGKTSVIRAIWAGDVSPALGGTVPEHLVIKDTPPVIVIHGGSKTELSNPLAHPETGRPGHDAGAGSQRDAAPGANDGSRPSDGR
jgi:pilus assembly protein CpaB